MRFPALTGFFLLFSLAGMAQPAHPLRLGTASTLAPVPDTFAKSSAVVMLDERRIEYGRDSKESVTFRTIHRRIRVLDDRGVASFNTVTLPLGGGRETVTIEARTITPSGKIIKVPSSAMKRQKGENGGMQTLFAMEGVEPGADIEYLYTELRETSVFGQETFGLPIPVVEARFELFGPERIKFRTKGYAGFPTATDSLYFGTRFFTATRYNLPALEEEPYSNAEAHAARIGYKVDGVTSAKSDEKEAFSWKALAEAMYPVYYEYSERERGTIRRFVSSLGLPDGASERRKIVAIEDTLKKSVAISNEVSGDDARDLASILKKKVTTEKGFVRLMTAALTEAGIAVEVGLTANHSEGAFDPDFANWITADEYVMYLPELKTFLAPSAVAYRYPFIPYVLTGQQGMFCKPSSEDPDEEAKAVIRNIPSQPADSNVHITTAAITFTGDDLVPHMQVTNAFKGYNAAGTRDVFAFTPKEKEKDLVHAFTGLTEKVEDITDYSVDGVAFSSYSTGTPLRVSATLDAPAMMERAGQKYLFKIGEVIGKQVEMYNDEKRMLPIEIEFAHSLVREIRVVPPAGFRIQNPEAVKASALPMGSGKDSPIGFVSDYKMDGTTLVVNIREHYSRVAYDIKDYAEFRQVINAAADWNKVVLVMVKK